ncbi:hypothetical protein KGY71_02240 [Candidatus Bipolaricaulota bacterium]|nr:hypothetical protein [Candidatus Bipolaricaulota bacterium]
MKKKISLTLVLLIVSLLPIHESTVSAGEGNGVPKDATLEELINAGDRAAKLARKDNRTREQLEESIRIYRRITELDPDNSHGLNMLSLGNFTLAEAYLEDWDERKAAYSRGYELGLRSLRTNDDFEDLYGEVDRVALKKLPESVDDVEGLFWTGANLGRLAERKGVMKSLADNDLPVLVSLNRRVLELDETYLGGGAHRNLGSIGAEVMSKMPLTLWQVRSHGFSWKKSRQHFERAIEIAPGCLENYLTYARYYALKKGKEELALDLLEKVIEKPLGDRYPLINEIAKEKARRLKTDILNG